MHADRAVRGARTAGYEKHARLAGQLAVRLGHVRSAAFLAADDEAQLLAQLVEAVEHRKVALARHAKSELDALRTQRVGENLSALPGLQIRFHRFAF
jgi:hypothetical protein